MNDNAGTFLIGVFVGAMLFIVLMTLLSDGTIEEFGGDGERPIIIERCYPNGTCNDGFKSVEIKGECHCMLDV